MIISHLNSIDFLGFVAGVFTTIAFLPQVIKTWESKSADDVSLAMFILFILGVSLWCLYGWEIHSPPVVIANLVTFVLAATILSLKVFFEISSSQDSD